MTQNPLESKVNTLTVSVKISPLQRAPSIQHWQHKDDIGVFGMPRECAPCPAVFPMQDTRVTVTRQWQFFIRAINYKMSLRHVAALFGPQKAFTNRNPSDLRADHLRGENLDRPDPDFDKVRTCALSVMTGEASGDDLIVTMLDGSQPPPLKEGRRYPERVEDINPNDYLFTPWTHRHFFFAANIIKPDGKTVPFPNGASYDWMGDRKQYSWMPHVSRFEVRYPLSNLIALPAGSPVPSPYT
ncbi:MAG TPA: hypothetical protein VFO91_04335 [Anaerolineales bacterium]|nr:hypothetical protein [Anaerolineales bacterium]